MKILIQTQYKENYGTPSKPYWKFKGGEDIILDVPGFRFNNEFANKNAMMVIDSIRDKIEFSNDMAEEYIVEWSFCEDDYMTSFEKSQLELDGEILYPAKRITLQEMINV